jgi:hypothetical protein
MSAELELIARLKNEAKAGLTDLKGNLKDMGVSAEKSSLQLAAVKQQSQLLETQTNKLARAVAMGEKSFDDAERELAEYKRGMADLGQQTTTADTKSRNFGATLQRGLQIYAQVAAGAAAMAVVFKKAFDFAEEGAQLELLEDRFGRLAASIGSNGEQILSALDEATGGMMTTAEQISAASQIISLGLATNEGDVVRLATLVSELGWDMSQVILTFANDSKMRLDSLGLSVTDVEERTRKFIAAGHDASEAFDLAVIEAGEAKLLLLGSAADSSAGAYQRLRVMTAELTDELKRWLAEGLTPVIRTINGDYGDAIGNTIEGNLAQVESMEDLIEAGQRLDSQYRGITRVAADLTGAGDEITEGMLATARAMARGSDSFEEYEDNLRLAFGDANLQRIHDQTFAMGLNQESLYRLERGMAQAELADRKFFAAQVDVEAITAEVAVALRQQAQAAYELSPAYDEFQDKLIQTNAQLSEEEAFVLRANQALRDSQTELGNLGGSLDTTGGNLDGFYTATDQARGITSQFRDEINRVKEDLFGVPPAADAAKTAWNIAAGEMWVEANRVRLEVEKMNEELDSINESYATEIKVENYQETFDAIAALKGIAEDTAGDYNINYNVTTTGSGPEGGGAAGGGAGDLPAPDVPGGNIGPGASSGLSNYMVPAGFNNDNFYIPVSSGEVVNVTTRTQQMLGGGGGIGSPAPPLTFGFGDETAASVADSPTTTSTGSGFVFSPTTTINAGGGADVERIRQVVRQELATAGRQAESQWRMRR